MLGDFKARGNGMASKRGRNTRRARENSFGWLVNALGRRMDAAMRAELAAHGLDLATFATLMTLYDEEGLTQTDLSSAVGVASYATTRTLDRMERQGLVERRPHPQSRRTHQVFLTEKGRALQPELAGIVARVNKEALRHLDPVSRKKLVGWLQEIERETR